MATSDPIRTAVEKMEALVAEIRALRADVQRKIRALRQDVKTLAGRVSR